MSKGQGPGCHPGKEARKVRANDVRSFRLTAKADPKRPHRVQFDQTPIGGKMVSEESTHLCFQSF